ncbi:lipid kinase YegS [Thalassotalea litorea]|uniref:Lipid kinase YegS n=1 Tax=Thalassotalea litorea TaxID=2020715 RepID=A0A5R9ID61_9GAMM|nr:lipid kinase YegS [Thalassotalea litorea]TLU61293.1 lipid kinase YegS [Thalassotalea litorea]
MAKPVRLLLNGKKAGLDNVRAAIFECRKQYDLDVRVTFEGGDIARFVQEASAEGVSRLIAGGGDGTVNETVSALMALAKDKRPELGILPLGTANDFATSALYPEGLVEALQVAITGKAYWIDVAKANEYYFINVASGGFGAQVTTATPVALKNFLGGGAYTLSGLIQAVNFTPFPGIIDIDDTQEEVNVIVAAVCNGRQAGGGQQLAPHAFINDGLLDIVAITEFPSEAVSEVLKELIDIQDKVQLDGKFVKRQQAKSVRWLAKESMPVNLDGEPISEKQITFSVAPAEIAMVLPNDCPLLAKE